jgi:hypothetical protein
MLKKSAADNVVRLMNSGTDRATKEMEGGNLKKASKKQLIRLIGAIGDKLVGKMEGMGSVGTMLKKSAADNVVKLMNSGTDRATQEMEGSSLFFPGGSSSDANFSKQGALDSANFVSSHQRGFKGLGINRLNKANRWQTFVDSTLRDTIDTAGKAGRVYYDTTSPLGQLGFGLKRHKRLSGKALLAAGY